MYTCVFVFVCCVCHACEHEHHQVLANWSLSLVAYLLRINTLWMIMGQSILRPILTPPHAIQCINTANVLVCVYIRVFVHAGMYVVVSVCLLRNWITTCVSVDRFSISLCLFMCVCACTKCPPEFVHYLNVVYTGWLHNTPLPLNCAHPTLVCVWICGYWQHVCSH